MKNAILTTALLATIAFGAWLENDPIQLPSIAPFAEATMAALEAVAGKEDK